VAPANSVCGRDEMETQTKAMYNKPYILEFELSPQNNKTVVFRTDVLGSMT
jgi:hypothetical protein